MNSQTDRIFSQPLAEVPDFVFNEDVVNVFPDMIKRSVPGYPSIVENTGLLAAQFARPNSVLYDLGCSLGAVTQAMRRHVDQPNCSIIGIDNSSAMVKRCQEYLCAQDAMFQTLLPAEIIEQDILQVDYQPSSFIALNFTLQFIEPQQRVVLLKKLRQALIPQGALLLSEKIKFTNADEHQQLNELHLAFKRANGYSDLEIAQKRRAIENVMLPDTFEVHRQRLLDAGFSKVYLWFQCLNFASMIALPWLIYPHWFSN